MNAQELLRRYAAGERDFRNATLCGINVSKQDLTGANFTGADIRGTNFTQAILHSANFTRAKGGRSRLWNVVAQLLSSLLVIAVALSQFAMWLGLILVGNLVVNGKSFPSLTREPTDSSLGMVLLGYVLVIGVGIVILLRRGLTGKILWVCSGIVTAAAILAPLVVEQDIPIEDIYDQIVQSPSTIAWGIAAITLITILALAMTLLAIATISVIIIATEVRTLVVAIALVIPTLLGPVGLIAFGVSAVVNSTTGNGGVPGYSGAGLVLLIALMTVGFTILVAAMLALAIPICAGLFVSRQAASGHPKVVSIRNLGLRLKTVWGTSFQGADLTAATFEQAQLAGVNFSPLRQHATALNLSNLQNARQVSKAFFGRSQLAQQVFSQPEQPYD